MTDGIIQEVFKKYSVMNEPIVWLLDTVEQELIEKIKQEITTYGEPLSREIIYKILIGDNQE